MWVLIQSVFKVSKVHSAFCFRVKWSIFLDCLTLTWRHYEPSKRPPLSAQSHDFASHTTRNYKNIFVPYYTRWFKYDRHWLCVNKSQFVPVIFEPPWTSAISKLTTLQWSSLWIIILVRVNTICLSLFFHRLYNAILKKLILSLRLPFLLPRFTVRPEIKWKLLFFLVRTPTKIYFPLWLVKAPL
jgi:hypothetical protein